MWEMWYFRKDFLILGIVIDYLKTHMTFTAIAIDDEYHALSDLAQTVSFIPRLQLLATFAKVAEALEFLAKNGPVDVIFCDVEMPGVSGLDAAPSLAEHCDMLLFATGHTQYRAQAMVIGVDGYLMKPVLPDKINERLDKLAKLRRHGGMLHATVPYGFFKDRATGRQVKVVLDQIVAVVSDPHSKNHIEIITPDQKLVVRGSLTGFLADEAVATRFIQLNQSTAVAKAAISHVHEGIVYLHDGRWYPVSRYYAPVLAAYRHGGTLGR